MNANIFNDFAFYTYSEVILSTFNQHDVKLNSNYILIIANLMLLLLRIITPYYLLVSSVIN